MLMASDLAAPFIGLVLQPNAFRFLHVILSRHHISARREFDIFRIYKFSVKIRFDLQPYSSSAEDWPLAACCNQSAQITIASLIFSIIQKKNIFQYMVQPMSSWPSSPTTRTFLSYNEIFQNSFHLIAHRWDIIINIIKYILDCYWTIPSVRIRYTGAGYDIAYNYYRDSNLYFSSSSWCPHLIIQNSIWIQRWSEARSTWYFYEHIWDQYNSKMMLKNILISDLLHKPGYSQKNISSKSW